MNLDERKVRIDIIKHLFEVTHQALYQQLTYHSTTSRVIRTKELFEKLPFFLSSFSSVYENSFLKNIPDDNTLASISRNIIELYNVFQYVNEYKLSKDEIDFRVFSMDLHQAAREAKILKNLGTKDENVMIRWDFMLYLVQNTDFYKTLTKDEQSNIKKAQRPYYWEYMKKRKHIVAKNIETALYDLLSNLVHSYPLSTRIRRNETPFSLLFSHEKVVFICIEVTIIYSASILWDYLSLRSTVFRNLIYEEKSFLKDCLNTESLLKFIDENKIQKANYFNHL